MNRTFRLLSLSLALALVVLTGCSTKGHQGYVGKFTDEFGNKFELHEDYTATIQFVGADPVQTRWSDGNEPNAVFATIEYNGNPAYYYLRDGALYRHLDYMKEGKMAIKIEYE